MIQAPLTDCRSQPVIASLPQRGMIRSVYIQTALNHFLANGG